MIMSLALLFWKKGNVFEKGNQKTYFMYFAYKPFLVCVKEIKLKQV